MIEEKTFEILKERIKESIRKKRNEGFEFTRDKHCPHCSIDQIPNLRKPQNNCSLHKWRNLRYQIGFVVFSSNLKELEDLSKKELEDLKKRLEKEIAIEMGIL